MEINNTVKKEKDFLKNAYKRETLKKKLFVTALIPIALILAAGSISFGSAEIGFSDSYRALIAKTGLLQNDLSFGTELIIWKLRLPRIIMGLVSGIALGSSGAVMQVILKNPLSDPYMLGIASAAGFGASLAIITGIGVIGGSFLIIGNAFLFSLIASALILLLSGKNGSSPEKMILTGLALLFFFQAMTTLIQYFGDSEAVKASVFWTVGDLGKAGWMKIGAVIPVVAAGTIYLMAKTKDLNIINTGDSSAKSLGVNPRKTRIRIMTVSSLMVASIVSFTGTIGFIGLVAPHIVRMITGNDNRILVPASGLTGGILLVISDTIARSIVPSIILPVGAVTAFLGVPLFLWLIMNKRVS